MQALNWDISDSPCGSPLPPWAHVWLAGLAGPVVTEACWMRPTQGEKKERRKVAGSALASGDVPCVGEEEEEGGSGAGAGQKIRCQGVCWITPALMNKTLAWMKGRCECIKAAAERGDEEEEKEREEGVRNGTERCRKWRERGKEGRQGVSD